MSENCSDCSAAAERNESVREGTRIFTGFLAIIFGALLAATFLGLIIQSEEISRPACATQPTAGVLPDGFQMMCVGDAMDWARAQGFDVELAKHGDDHSSLSPELPTVVFHVEGGVVLHAFIHEARDLT